VVAGGLWSCAGLAAAQDASPPMFSFSGFGTLGVVHSSRLDADFTGGPSEPFGAGYTHAWSAEPDTLVAAQVSAQLTQRLSAVVQLVSEQGFDHSYRPRVEWANVKFQVTPDLSLRAGRTVLPLLMLADVRKVGYARPWVRPPVELYGLVPVTSSDGLDASYRWAVGAGTTSTFQLTAGRTDSDFPGATSKARDLVVFVDTFEFGHATVRANFGRARITLPALDPLIEGYRAFGPAGAEIADRYEMKERLVNFVGLGASYEPPDWFAMGEWSYLKGDGVLGTKSAWYVSGGYRIGKLTPYATYSSATADNLFDPGLNVAALPPYLAAPAIALNLGLNATLGAKVVQSTMSLGMRWDATQHTAVKVQFDRTRIASGSNGALGNLQPGFQQGGKVDLFSASVDFIFR
jgi:hypothetical protein